MANDLWLPNGYTVADGAKIKSLLYSGEEWQIFDTDGSNRILLVRPNLAQKWNESGFLADSLLVNLTFGKESFRLLNSPKKYILCPVENVTPPKNKNDALAFALALKESRKLSKDDSFHDAIYVEQYSKLLPTWTLTSRVDDEVVLGTWMSGGVIISTESFRRLNNLTSWMPPDDLAAIIQAAGFNLPFSLGQLSKNKYVFAEPEQPYATENIVKKETFKLPGRPQIETFFNEHVIDIIFNTEKYQIFGINFPSAIVLYGPPGCGKTFAVERLVEFIDWPNYSIDSNSIGSPYIHATSKKISELFDKAINDAPSIITIDEMEAFLSDRQFGSTSGLHRVEEVAEFLRRIPEAIKNNVLIIAMTNMIDMIDPAILRRGRFDHLIEVGMPAKEEVTSLLDSLLSKLPKADNLNLDKIINELTGRALSDSSFVVREAARLAAKAGKEQLDQDSLEAALVSLPQNHVKDKKRIGFV